MKYVLVLITIISITVLANLPPTQLKGGNEAKLGTTFNFNLGQIPVTRTGTSVIFGTIPVTQGGTSSTSLTQYSLMSGNGTGAVNMIAPSTSGTILFSNGASAFPSYRALGFDDITTGLGYTPIASSSVAVEQVLGYVPLASSTAAVISTLGYTPVASVTANLPLVVTGGASNPVISLEDSGAISGSTYTKVMVNGKGLVTSGTTLLESDIPPLQTTKITSGVFTVANGGTGVSSVVTGDLLVGAGSDLSKLPIGSNGHVLTASGGTAAWASNPAGKIVQVVTFQTGTVSTGSTTIPLDNTIPQITEGNEYMNLSITPSNSANKLKIDVIIQTDSNATGVRTVALFQDSTANALATVLEGAVGAGVSVSLKLTHVMTAGTTSATTFRVRAGLDNGNTFTFNGRGGAGVYGGSIASTIVITEYTP